MNYSASAHDYVGRKSLPTTPMFNARQKGNLQQLPDALEQGNVDGSTDLNTKIPSIMAPTTTTTTDGDGDEESLAGGDSWTKIRDGDGDGDGDEESLAGGESWTKIRKTSNGGKQPAGGSTIDWTTFGIHERRLLTPDKSRSELFEARANKTGGFFNTALERREFFDVIQAAEADVLTFPSSVAFSAPDPDSPYKDEEPLPQLVVHGELEGSENYSEEDDDETRSKRELVHRLHELFPRDEDVEKVTRKIKRQTLEKELLTKQIHISWDARLGDETDQKLEEARKALGYPPFKYPQGEVCHEAATYSDRDIFLVAPCGFGKSACFAISAVLAGGITVVIHPFRPQIDSHLDSFRGMAGIDVENLFQDDDIVQGDDDAGDGKRLSASSRLHYLATHSNNSNPIVIFATPGMINLPASLKALSVLSQQGKLKRIVLDEFDIIDEARDAFRAVYLDLFQKLRHHCRYRDRAIQIMMLSATVTKSALIASRKSADSLSRATVFLAERALPILHKYCVERRKSDLQVATRIHRILQEYEAKHGQKAKSVCFCLVPSVCSRMASRLRQLGLKVAVLDGQANSTGRSRDIISSFRKGDTQILCATKVLGRGFQEIDIRFIFHAVMPLSLRDYIRETGRGGRDYNQATCVLFFSHYDRPRVKTIVGPSRGRCPTLDERKRTAADLNQVIAYAMNGNECRSNFLARCVTPDGAQKEEHSMCANGFNCDNCCALMNKRDVTHIVEDCLKKVLGLSKSRPWITEAELGKLMKDALAERYALETDQEHKALLKVLAINIGETRKSLVDELSRYLRSDSTYALVGFGARSGNTAWTDWKKAQTIMDVIRNRTLKFFVQYVRGLPESKKSHASMDVTATSGA